MSHGDLNYGPANRARELAELIETWKRDNRGHLASPESTLISYMCYLCLESALEMAHQMRRMEAEEDAMVRKFTRDLEERMCEAMKEEKGNLS